MTLPRAILFDLDDTLISAYRQPELAWAAIAAEFAADLHPLPAPLVADAISRSSERFWSDPDRHREGRHRLHAARMRIVMEGLDELVGAGHPPAAEDLPHRLAERYRSYRDEQMALFDGAHEVVDELRRRGVRLALVTNGTATQQRAKIVRFALEHRFDHIQIEGEHGFGKPEERAYRHAMAALDVAPADTWMVGDNLEWEIAAPQRLGIYAIWHDSLGQGLPPDSPVRPDRIIRSLYELVPPPPTA
jgi:putative hydrolase of the HAD superfamily